MSAHRAEVIKCGEIVIMEDQNEQNRRADPARDRFQAEFDALPLDQKFARLFRMEATTLTETVEYVFKSPMEVVGKVGDAISDFAGKVETEFRKASRANQEQCEPEAKSPPPPRPAKPKGRPTRKNVPPEAPNG